MSENPKVLIETSLGNITVELFEKEAPVTVANFLAYVDDNYYAGTIFHRVIKGFMIQGGGLDANLRNVPSKRGPIKNEAGNGLSNKVGTIAMARTSVVDSATSQFFINTAPNNFRPSGRDPARVRLLRLRAGHGRHGRGPRDRGDPDRLLGLLRRRPDLADHDLPRQPRRREVIPAPAQIRFNFSNRNRHKLWIPTKSWC